MDEKTCVDRKEFNIERDYVREELRKHSESIVELKTLYVSLKELPGTIQNLDKTIALMGQNLEQLNSKFDKFEEKNSKTNEEQNQRISSMNDKSKIDIIEILKKHWFEFVFVGYLIMQMVEKYR